MLLFSTTVNKKIEMDAVRDKKDIVTRWIFDY